MRTGTAEAKWLLGDHLGSTSVVANYAGTLYAGQGYKAWGEQRYSTGITPLPTTFRYTGQRKSASFGLYYYGARWYDPALGRFVQADTVIPEASQGVQAWDRYAGMNNNPVRYIDPHGNSVDCGLGDPYCQGGRLNTQLRALDLALSEKYEHPNFGFGTLTNQERSILDEGGWSAGGFEEFMRGGNVSRADLWHDPLTYLLIVVGTYGTYRAVGALATTLLANGVGGGNTTPQIDPNKLNHIFNNPEHNLGGLEQAFGSQEAAFEAVQNAFSKVANNFPADALKEGIAVTVNGFTIIVKGVIVNGVARIGTFFNPQ